MNSKVFSSQKLQIENMSGSSKANVVEVKRIRKPTKPIHRGRTSGSSGSSRGSSGRSSDTKSEQTPSSNPKPTNSHRNSLTYVPNAADQEALKNSWKAQVDGVKQRNSMSEGKPAAPSSFQRSRPSSTQSSANLKFIVLGESAVGKFVIYTWNEVY